MLLLRWLILLKVICCCANLLCPSAPSAPEAGPRYVTTKLRWGLCNQIIELSSLFTIGRVLNRTIVLPPTTRTRDATHKFEKPDWIDIPSGLIFDMEGIKQRLDQLGVKSVMGQARGLSQMVECCKFRLTLDDLEPVLEPRLSNIPCPLMRATFEVVEVVSETDRLIQYESGWAVMFNQTLVKMALQLVDQLGGPGMYNSFHLRMEPDFPDVNMEGLLKKAQHIWIKDKPTFVATSVFRIDHPNRNRTFELANKYLPHWITRDQLVSTPLPLEYEQEAIVDFLICLFSARFSGTGESTFAHMVNWYRNGRGSLVDSHRFRRAFPLLPVRQLHELRVRLGPWINLGPKPLPDAQNWTPTEVASLSATPAAISTAKIFPSGAPVTPKLFFRPVFLIIAYTLYFYTV